MLYSSRLSRDSAGHPSHESNWNDCAAGSIIARVAATPEKIAGTLRSRRRLFTLLGVGQGKQIHMTSIDASQELTARRTGGAAGYLRSHGYEVEANPIASRVHPAEVLSIEIADRKIGTLVMGA